MYIKKVVNYDKDSKEAEVIVSDGNYDILCCAWTYNSNIKNFYLDAFLIKDIEKSYEFECYANLNKRSYFSYDICGQLKQNGKVAVGQILIDIDLNAIPKDIQVNDYIKFNCIRLDFIQK